MYILTVKELFSNIKVNIESCYPFVMVKGSITNIKNNSGNLYFTLSDCTGKCTINCVIWENKIYKLTINPLSNSILNKEVIIKGYIRLYQSSTRIILSTIDIVSIKESNLYIFNSLKENKLSKLGYFDKNYKKTIPMWCDTVGVITSQNSAAEQDVINSIKKRFPAKILLYNTNIQGCSSVINIKVAIEYFNDLPPKNQPKVLLIARGGGSKEDLDTFNEEQLVVTIFKSKIPIVTAIGHSNDLTLSDYAADYYAITPTAAAEILFNKSLYSHKTCIDYYLKVLTSTLLKIINFYSIKKHIIETKISTPNWVLYNSKNVITELQKNIQSTVQDKYKEYLHNLKTIQMEFTNLIKSLVSKYENSFLSISTQLVTIKPNLLNQDTALNYLTNTLINKVLLTINYCSTTLYNLNNILTLNSYPHILKKGFTLIKDPYTNTILKNSSDLLNKSSFEIIFYDKIVKIHSVKTHYK